MPYYTDFQAAFAEIDRLRAERAELQRAAREVVRVWTKGRIVANEGCDALAALAALVEEFNAD